MQRSTLRRRWPVLVSVLGLLMALTVPAFAAPPTTTQTYGPDGDDLMVENGNNMWVLDADTGDAYHKNLKNGRTNDISIASFLRVWYDATGTATTTTQLWATYGYLGCGSTTWQTGSDFTTRFVSYADGLVISFEVTAPGESGEVAYTIQGQNGPRDWGGGHTQVRAFQDKALSGFIGADPWYVLTWDTALNTSLGSIFETGGQTALLLGGTSNAAGFNLTNCGPNSLVWPNTTIRWYVDSLDIVLP